MASKTDIKGRSYMKVNKSHTSLLIPDLLPSDTTDDAVVTLFNEENELGPTTKSDNLSMSELQLTTTSTLNSKNLKRKLEIEFVSLSQTTPRRKSEKFSHLQNFWENKSGSQSAIKLHIKPIETKSKDNSHDNIGSPIDKALKNFSVRSPSTPARSASEIASSYTQLIHRVNQSKNVQQEKDYIGSSVYDFNENDDEVERMSLKEFRQSKSTSPNKAVVKMGTKSSVTFDPKKFYVKKSPASKTSSPLMKSVVNADKPTVNSELEDSYIMPPPDSLPKHMSHKKNTTSSPITTPKLTPTATKPCQKLSEEYEFSPDHLISPSPETGVKRKHASKKRLMSLEPCHYSQLYTPSDDDISFSEQNFTKPASVTVTVNKNSEITIDNVSCTDTDVELWTESKSEISLSNVSVITPILESRNRSVIYENCAESSSPKQVDSFFDITLNSGMVEKKQSEVNIDDLSAIASENKSAMNSLSFNCSELSTPEVVKVSGGKKKLILEKKQTTLNETLLSVGDISCDETSIKVDVANTVKAVVGDMIGCNDSSGFVGEDINMDAVRNGDKDQGSEKCEDSRLSNTLPEPCDQLVLVNENVDIVDGNGNVNNFDNNDSEDVTPEATSEDSPESDSDNSMSTDYDSVLVSPPPLHIDLSKLEDMSSQCSIKAVQVTENIKYEPSNDIVNLDKYQPHTYTNPETLKTLSVNKLVVSRSAMYDNLSEENVTSQSSYLSMPISVNVTSELHGLTDPCYSPDLACSESLSLNTSELSSRNTCWSPDLGSEIDLDHFGYETDTIYTTDTSDYDTDYGSPSILTKRKTMKRRLTFDSEDENSNSPSPKLPKTPQTDKHFEFPVTNEMDKTVQKKVDEQTDNGACVKSEVTEMKSLSDIYEKEFLEESYLSDTDYPESLNSSSAYSDCFTFWSSSSSVSTDRQWSPTSSSLGHDDDEKSSAFSGETETFPVYTQEGPTHLKQQKESNAPASPKVTSQPLDQFSSQPLDQVSSQPVDQVSSQPLDLSMTGEKENIEPKTDSATSLSDSVENDIDCTREVIDYYEPICISEPCVATLGHNYSNVWKEIDIGSVSYSYSPSDESTQYATDCFNNAVYGVSNMSGNEPFYIATALYQNPSTSVTSPVETVNQSKDINSCVNIPQMPGVTVPLQNYPSVIPAGFDVTLPNSSPCPQNYNIIQHVQMPSISVNTNQNEMTENLNGYSDACYYGYKPSSSNGSRIKGSLDGYESSGNSAENSSGSDSENDLFKMMDNSVRGKLEKRTGSRFISPDAEQYELSESLKCVKPYVISGWISSTYLMALVKKTDLVNDMFDDALNNKGEIHDWVLENCRQTTPAVLARDLLFRLFTLEELKDLNLTSLTKRKKFKAIKKCVEKQFPGKINKSGWSKCLALIKSSVSTLFKHRVKQVQNFFAMHGTCN